MFYYVEFLQLTVVHYINKRFAALVIGCYFYCIVLFTVRSHVIYNYNRVILRAVRTEFACKIAIYRAAAQSLLAQSAYGT